MSQNDNYSDDNEPELTRLAIRRIINFEIVDKPVLRLVDFQQGSRDDPNSMFVLELSDGNSSFDNCVVNTQPLIRRLYEKEFIKSSIVVLNDYHFHKNLQFLYIKGMDIMADVRHIHQQSHLEVGPNRQTLGSQAMESQSLTIPEIASLEPQPMEDRTLEPLNEVLDTPHEEPKSTETQPLEAVLQCIERPQIENNMETESVSTHLNMTSIKSSQDMTTLGPSDVQPINTITANESNDWVVRGRVTLKGKKRRWDNQNGNGSVFSFVLSDRSGDIRLNAFNRLCDKYYQSIEENKVYRISEGAVKCADKRFSNLSNDYEIIVTSETKIVECPPEESFTVNVCKPRFQFVLIKELADKPIGSVVDVIGAVIDVGQCYWISSKQCPNQKIAKRDIILMDTTDTDINLTLWKEIAEQFVCQIDSIIAVQSAVLKDFGGLCLTAYANTNIKVGPDVPEIGPIREWLSNRQQLNICDSSLMSELSTSSTSNQISPVPHPMAISRPLPANSAGRIKVVLLDQITEQSIVGQNQTLFYVRARVMFPINRSPLYKSCHRPRCFKKVIPLPAQEGVQIYRCTNCVEETPHFQWRLQLAVVLIDSTTEQWVQLFDKEFAKLIGCTALELSQYTEHEQYERVLHFIEFKTYLWKLKAKLQTFLTHTSIQLNCLDLWPSDPIKDSKEIIKNIRRLTQN